MFDSNSRYYNLETKTLTAAGGRKIAYVSRRFLPQGRAMPLLAEASVEAGDRLDLLANRTLGDPEQFWQIADANDAMNPTDLVAASGQLRIPLSPA